MTTHRLFQLPRTSVARKSRLAFVALATLAAAACSDTTAPIHPGEASTAVAPAAKPARTPYISDFQLHSIYIDIAPDGTYDNGYELTVSNPGQKTDGVYFQVDLQQGTNIEDGGGSSLYCSSVAGVLPRGTCRMTWWVSSPTYPFVRGPARLTIRLLQIQNDGPIVTLDSRTVDVEIVHS
ncbi:MAG TPA: hypothetical protein VHR41_16605 [Gemmatimonadales bacterium]|jgi:hypothetical protein|nr:hypothetical protein [Gemmatimonadales bacterium]